MGRGISRMQSTVTMGTGYKVCLATSWQVPVITESFLITRFRPVTFQPRPSSHLLLQFFKKPVKARIDRSQFCLTHWSFCEPADGVPFICWHPPILPVQVPARPFLWNCCPSNECCRIFFIKLIVVILPPWSFWIYRQHVTLLIIQSCCSACIWHLVSTS